MFVSEQSFSLPAQQGQSDLIDYFRQACRFRLDKGSVPIRFAVTASDAQEYKCEIGAAEDVNSATALNENSIFDFRRRETEDTSSFNAVFLVPTGIGAEIGGHAGDATPGARMLAQSCDELILHPNAVNASDINEAPENSLYLEGSVITRLMMGSIGLQRVRSNRLLVVIDGDHEDIFVNATLNSVDAARACYGVHIVDVLKMIPPVRLAGAFSEAGRAAGTVENLDYLFEVLAERRQDYDAVAIASIIDIPDGSVLEYFASDGTEVNPWGGVEAMLTHAISAEYDVPSAHAPMMEGQDIANADLGQVDPRMAAEAVSMTFLNCVMKGLQKSPKIISDASLFNRPEIFTASNVSCLVIPEGCLGLPTLAALEQGIPVIAVKENRNLMRNELAALPWKPGQYFEAESYLEASGVINALKAGIEIGTLRRPLGQTKPQIVSRERQETIPRPGDGKTNIG